MCTINWQLDVCVKRGICVSVAVGRYVVHCIVFSVAAVFSTFWIFDFTISHHKAHFWYYLSFSSYQCRCRCLKDCIWNTINTIWSDGKRFVFISSYATSRLQRGYTRSATLPSGSRVERGKLYRILVLRVHKQNPANEFFVLHEKSPPAALASAVGLVG